MEQARLAEMVLPVRATARNTATWAREKGTFTSGATMTDAATTCCPAGCRRWMLLLLLWWPVQVHTKLGNWPHLTTPPFFFYTVVYR